MSQSPARTFNILGVISLIVALGAVGVAIVVPGPTGPTGATGAAGSNGANGATGPSGIINSTTITYSGTSTDSAPTTTMAKLATIGNFTKTSASTRIEVTWDSHFSGTGGGSCDFQFRVDGVQYVPYGPIVISANGAQFSGSETRIFTGLASGNHQLTIWDRAVTATSCSENPGNFIHWATVIEF